RLRELLTPSSPLLLAPNPKGKLDYKVVAVKKSDEWILINTQVHSKIAQRLIEEGYLGFKPKEVLREVKVGKSRIDFLIDKDFYLEVKGCNLVVNGTCLFPDAPTERGRKHLEELIALKRKGYRAGVLFLAFRRCSELRPNSETDPAFSEAFERAKALGVEFFAFNLSLHPLSGKVRVVGKVPV
ncbi:MAG: DNA/RNA nuclease SfsA, partial [Desulfurobacteriaceae bacterium]